jgi:hypothetical protein
MRSKLFALALAALVAMPLAGCRVRQTEQGELPEVDVEVKEGELPEYDVDAADVDVKTRETEIEVPTDVDVDVETEKRKIEVPEVDIEPPRDGDQDPPRQ